MFFNSAAGLSEVIIYSSPDDRRNNRGFCFLDYDSHQSASIAKRRLSTGRVKIFGRDVGVYWADPQEEPDSCTMSKVISFNQELDLYLSFFLPIFLLSYYLSFLPNLSKRKFISKLMSIHVG